jgi:hypothetical protein
LHEALTSKIRRVSRTLNLLSTDPVRGVNTVSEFALDRKRQFERNWGHHLNQ